MIDRSKTIEETDHVLAADLIVVELTNAIWNYHRFERLEVEIFHQVLEFSLGLVDTLVSAKELYREAFLTARAGRLLAYDIFYLALARREDAVLDQGMRKEARRIGARVI